MPATRPIDRIAGNGVDDRLASDGAEGDVPCYALDLDVTLDFVEPHIAGRALHVGAIEAARCPLTSAASALTSTDEPAGTRMTARTAGPLAEDDAEPRPAAATEPEAVLDVDEELGPAAAGPKLDDRVLHRSLRALALGHGARPSPPRRPPPRSRRCRRARGRRARRGLPRGRTLASSPPSARTPRLTNPDGRVVLRRPTVANELDVVGICVPEVHRPSFVMPLRIRSSRCRSPCGRCRDERPASAPARATCSRRAPRGRRRRRSPSSAPPAAAT